MNTLYDAFISYGRADSKAFANRLYNSLMEQGFNVWFDQNDIPQAIKFQSHRLEKSHNFLFIIAPSAVNAEYCYQEIQLATKLNKRIIPLLHVENIDKATWQQRTPTGTDADWEAFQQQNQHSSHLNMLPMLGKLTWIYFREEIDDFETSFTMLVEAMRHHADYVAQHTQILIQGLEWEQQQNPTSHLLIAEERLQAERWLKIGFHEEQPPCEPTDLHCEFICESITNANNLMTQVFFSYAENEYSLMERLIKTLRRESITVWTKKTDAQTGVESQQEVYKGIEKADNFIYLISPASVRSKYCDKEIKHAFAHNKRIILLLVDPIKLVHLPQEAQGLPFIDFTAHQDEELYQRSAEKLLAKIKQDARYYQQHKILLVKALKWQEQNRNPSILLRGYNLQHFATWLTTAKQRTEHPALALQEEFISESHQQSTDLWLEVFISYSRADSDFARQLNDVLQTQGKTTWFDQESIAAGEDFQQEIHRGIEKSDNFLFIISPNSVNSPYCADEVEYAQRLEKRFVTVLYRKVSSEQIHPLLRRVQWIDFSQPEEDFYSHFNELVRTLDTDREHVRSHSKWVQRAREWRLNDKSADLLLRGHEFSLAEHWLKTAEQQHKQPQTTDLQKDFILTSQQAILAEKKREKRHIVILRALLATVSIAFVMAISFGWYALVQKDLAHQQKELALRSQSMALSALAQQNIENSNAVNGMLLALAALPKSIAKLERPYVAEAELALYNAVLNQHERAVLSGHKSVLWSAAWSPNGQQVVTTSRDGTARIWQVETGQPLWVLEGHQKDIKYVTFSPNGKRVLTTSNDKTARLWNAETGQLLVKLEHDNIVHHAQFNPVEPHVVVTVSQDKMARRWDANTGELLTTFSGHKGAVYYVDFSFDGKQIVTASRDMTARVWEANSGELVTQLIGHQGLLTQAIFSPDGKQVLTASTDDTARLWQTDTGQLLTQFIGHQGNVTQAFFSPDGQQVLTASQDKTARLWNTNTGELIRILEGHHDVLTSVTFSPDGKQILTASKDKMVRLWETKTGQRLTSLAGHTDVVWQATFSPDGKQILTTSWDKTARLWNVSLDQQVAVLAEPQEPIYHADFSPDGQYVGTAGKLNVQLWNASTKKPVTLLTGHQDIINHIAFRPNNQQVVTASKDGTVRLWEIDTGEAIAEFKHDKPVSYVNFSRNGKMFVTKSQDQLLSLWDINNRDKAIFVWSGHKAIFSPDSQHILSWWWKNAQLWDVNTGTLVVELADHHKKKITYAAFRSDGKRIVTSSQDKTAGLWNAETGKLIAVLDGHQREVMHVAFSPDGKHIVTASRDKTARLWDGNTGEPLFVLRGHDFYLTYADFSPDSQRVITTSRDATARLWNVNTGQPVAILKGHEKTIYHASFRSDGQQALTVSWGGTARLWQIFPDTQNLIDYANEVVPRRLTAEQKKHFVLE